VLNTRADLFRRLLNRQNGSGTNEKIGTSRVHLVGGGTAIGIKLPDWSLGSWTEMVKENFQEGWNRQNKASLIGHHEGEGLNPRHDLSCTISATVWSHLTTTVV
jgi:hypothetical protein